MPPNEDHLETRNRFIPSGLANEIMLDVYARAASFEPGVRTGKFRLGGDALLVGEHGSRISFEDYAVALVDEIERPAHHRQRFTVSY